MNAARPELTEQERTEARNLWERITKARTQQERLTAQQQLSETTPHVQQAIINAIGKAVKEQKTIDPDNNPFD